MTTPAIQPPPQDAGHPTDRPLLNDYLLPADHRPSSGSPRPLGAKLATIARGGVGFVLGVLWPNLIGVGMYFAMMLANDLRPVSYGFATHWSARADLLPLVIWCVAGVLLIGAFILAAKRCAWALCAGLIVGLLALPIVGMVLAFISCSQPDGGK